MRLPWRSSSRGRGGEPAHRPLLAIDIDGVIVLLGEEESGPSALVRLELIDGMLRRVSLGAGDCLRRLSGHYELVWASGWQERANRHFCEPLGLPELPYVDFEDAARWGSADWKLEPLARYAGERPLAWLDDNFDESCHAWARQRQAPTLLVAVDPLHGLDEEQTEALIVWAADYESGSPEPL